jgi:hypothetical protein
MSSLPETKLLQSLGRVARGNGSDLEKARVAAELVADQLGALNRPDRWRALNLILCLFEYSPPIFWGVFLEWCYDSEANCVHGLKTRLQRVHRRQPAYEFLSKENRRAFDALPEWVEVYRGQEAKLLVKQNHPDRVHSMAPAFKQLAEAETKKLNVAYAQALSFFRQDEVAAT